MAEQDNSFASAAVPEVQNKAPKPPGILPKNAQTWIILGIAALMICVIAFSSGGTAPKPKKASDRNPAVAPSQRRIEEYRTMVDEEARRLGLERQKLEQARAQANAAAASLNLPEQQQLYPAQHLAAYAPAPYASPQPSQEHLQQQAVEAERRKREYTSLFASNLALTNREQNRAALQPADANLRDPFASLQEMENNLRQLAQPRTAEAGPTANGSPAPAVVSQNTRADIQGRTSDAGPASESPRKLGSDDPDLQRAEGKSHRIFEGTVIETVLTNRLNGSFSGPVNAMVTTTVYSHDLQKALVPQGSRMLGEVQKINSFGQQRLAVFFRRLIMPDGFSVNLDQFRGLNQIGETGLRDKVNHHYAQIFGVSLAVGAIAGIAQANTRYGFDTSGLDVYQQGFSSSLSNSALRILDRYLNILPTFTIREGHRIKVYLTGDLLIPAYDQHRMPGDL